MSKWRDIYLKDRKQRKTWKQLTRVPKAQQTIRILQEQTNSEFDLIYLGWNEQDGPVTLAHEEREGHMHIMGLPGEGKSKLLELLIRADIDRLIDAQTRGKPAPGLCLLDPSSRGGTAKKILNYCIEKNYTKVILIDPDDIQRRQLVPTINPIQYKAPARVVRQKFMDTVGVLFNRKNQSDTPRIARYLPSLITCLHQTRYTLAEVKYFMTDDRDPKHRASSEVFANRRERIMNRKGVNEKGEEYYLFHPLNLKRKHLERAFKDRYTAESFQSTVNSLDPFTDEIFEVMFGAVTGTINWYQMIRDGYVILVNLSAVGWGQLNQRLLGTLIINELVYCKERLWDRGYTVPYYLYIDEVGQYPTSKLADIMHYQRHNNIRLVVAHQHFSQIEDHELLAAFYGGGTKIHVLFNVDNPDDRHKMVRLMFGGDLKDRDVEFALKDTAKQNAYFKINKRPPLKVEIADIPDVKKTPAEVEAFKDKYIYNRQLNPFYRPIPEVREEIKNRFVLQSDSSQSASPKYHGDRKQKGSTEAPAPARANQQGAPGVESAKPSQGQDKGSNQGSSAFDRLPHSGAVLPAEEKGRKKPSSGRATTRKRNDNPPAAK